jgi:hypothetical protein
MARIKEALVKDLLSQVQSETISFSRMVELINEEAQKTEVESNASFLKQLTKETYLGYKSVLKR